MMNRMTILSCILVLNIIFNQGGLTSPTIDKLSPDDMILIFKEFFPNLGTKKEDVSNQIFCLKDFKLITKSFNNIIIDAFSAMSESSNKIVLFKPIKKLLMFIIHLFQKNKECFQAHPENLLNRISFVTEDYLKEMVSTLELSRNDNKINNIMEEILTQYRNNQFNRLGITLAKLAKETILTAIKNPKKDPINAFSIYHFIITFFNNPNYDSPDLQELCISNNFMNSSIIPIIVENSRQRPIDEIIEFWVDVLTHFNQLFEEIIDPCIERFDGISTFLNHFEETRIINLISSLFYLSNQIREIFLKLKKINNLNDLLEEGNTFRQLYLLLFGNSNNFNFNFNFNIKQMNLNFGKEDLEILIFGFTNKIPNANSIEISKDIEEQKDLIIQICNHMKEIIKFPIKHFINFFNFLNNYNYNYKNKNKNKNIKSLEHNELVIKKFFDLLNDLINSIDALKFKLSDVRYLFKYELYSSSENPIQKSTTIMKFLKYLSENILEYESTIKLIEQRKYYALGQALYDFVSYVFENKNNYSIKKQNPK